MVGQTVLKGSSNVGQQHDVLNQMSEELERHAIFAQKLDGHKQKGGTLVGLGRKYPNPQNEAIINVNLTSL